MGVVRSGVRLIGLGRGELFSKFVLVRKREGEGKLRVVLS